MKLRSASLTEVKEEIIDAFKPVKYSAVEGILVLTGKRLIFVVEKGLIQKSFTPIFSVKLSDLEIKPLTSEEVRKRVSTDTDVEHIFAEVGQFAISSTSIVPFFFFYNTRIFPQVQKSKGLVKHRDDWITPKEETQKYAPVYVNKVIQNPAIALVRERTRALLKRIKDKEVSCCVCGKPNVSSWIVDAAHLQKTTKKLPLERMLVFVRLLCKDHEEKWKKGDTVKYVRINGAMLLNLPYLEMIWSSLDVKWSAFMDMIVEQGGATIIDVSRVWDKLPLENSLTKDSHLMFGGELMDFIEVNNTSSSETNSSS